MGEQQLSTEQLEHWLLRHRQGDSAAREALINYSCERLRRLTRKLLCGYPTVQRWEETDDVLQRALLRLHRSLQQVQPDNLRAYLGLAATQIRRELTDLARHYGGPLGLGANHDTGRASCSAEDGRARIVADPADDTAGPATLQLWSEFHQHVASLPDEQREVFDLLFYQGMQQSEAARLLGVSERTVKRRWRAARLALHEVLGHDLAD